MANRTFKPVVRQAKMPLREALGQLREGGRQLEDFVSHELEQLETLRVALEQREIALRAREEELRSSEQSLENQRLRLEQLRQSTEAYARSIQLESHRLAQQKNQVDDEPVLGADDTTSDKTHRSLLRERSRLQKQLASAHEQIGRLASSTLELAQTRGELAKANASIGKLQHRLAEQKGHFEPAMRQRLDASERERARLEVELEHVKEALADHQSQRDAHVLGELVRVRELIDQRPAFSRPRDQCNSPPQQPHGDDNLERLISQLDSMRVDLASACDARR